MVCGNCGAALAADERFCRNCGAAASAGVPPPDQPTVEEAWGAPIQPAPAQARGQRPGWLIPVLILAAVLVAAAIVGAVVVGAGGSKPRPLADQAGPAVSTVNSDLATLSSGLAEEKSTAALRKAATQAHTLAADANAAAVTVRGLDVARADETAQRLLAAWLDATQTYAQSVAAAAANPGSATVAPVAAAATAAKASLAALAAGVPDLMPTIGKPPPNAFSVVALTKVAGPNGATAYVARIDTLLSESARTRGSLGDLIAGVSKNSIPADAAAAKAEAIVAQRRALEDSVSAVRAPAAFRRPAALLTASLAAAIADDLAIQSWVLSKSQGDQVGADNAWRAHLAATAKATAAKQAFVTAYDAARKALGLGPLAVGDKY